MDKDIKIIKEIRKNSNGYNNIESAIEFLEGGRTSHRMGRYKLEFDAVQRFLKQSSLSKNSNVLDIGCSGGRYIQLLLNNNFRPHGIDTSMVALKHAKSLFSQNAVYVNSSVTHLPFKENTFDIVLCIELLHHFEENYFEKILKDISHLVKPGGILICDLRNSLNPVLWHSYKKRDGIHFTLKTRSIFKMKKILEKNGFLIDHKESLFFPISLIAPYVMFFCRKR